MCISGLENRPTDEMHACQSVRIEFSARIGLVEVRSGKKWHHVYHIHTPYFDDDDDGDDEIVAYRKHAQRLCCIVALM